MKLFLAGANSSRLQVIDPREVQEIGSGRELEEGLLVGHSWAGILGRSSLFIDRFKYSRKEGRPTLHTLCPQELPGHTQVSF